jgi:ubiquinone/menaquinone biosynthesis C-methylase UbiE
VGLTGTARSGARVAYHQARKRILRADIHEKVTRVTLKHLARYQRAAPLVSNRAVLDAACGCGYGAMLMPAAMTYKGIDLDHRAITSARREFPEFNYTIGSVYGLPVDTASVGAVTSFETLEHIPDPAVAVGEFARVLEAGGILIGSIPIDHPDTIYHVRPYSAREAFDIFSCDRRLSVMSIHAQHDLDFLPVAVDNIAEAKGTMIAVLRRSDCA